MNDAPSFDFDVITLNGVWWPVSSCTIELSPEADKGWSEADERQWWTAVPTATLKCEWPRSVLRIFYRHHLPRRLRRGKK